MNKNILVYARVSTEEQESKGFSLTEQLKQLKEHAKAQGYKVVGEFSESFSGQTLERPELDRARDLVSRGNVDVFLVTRTDRVSRGNPANYYLLKSEFEKYGTQIQTIADNGRDNETPESNLYRNFDIALAEYEVSRLKERSRRGRREKIAQGIYLGNGIASYGFRRIGEHRETRLEIDDCESKVVVMVFDWFLAGMGSWQIAKRLTELGIPSQGDKTKRKKKRGNSVWSVNMVYNILTNESYTGTLYHNRYRTIGKTASGKAKRVELDKAEWIAVKVPAIICKEQFDLAQTKLAANKGSTSKKHDYLLSGKLTCQCGYHMSGKSRHYYRGDKTYFYQRYLCNTHSNRIVDCSMPVILTSKLDNPLMDFVEELLEVSPKKEKAKVAKPVKSNTQSELELVVERLLANSTQQERLLDLYLGGDMTKDKYNTRKAELDRVGTKLEQDKRRLESEIATGTITPEQLKAVKAKAGKLLIAIPASQLVERNQKILNGIYRELMDDMKISAKVEQANSKVVLVMRSGVEGYEEKRVIIQ